MKADKPSTTSMMVALGSYCVAQEISDGKVDPRIRDILCVMLRSSPQPFALLARLSRLRFVRLALEKLMNLVIPGMFTHYLARKLFIESRIRNAIAEGCRQVVVIGGGLDTLALRISQDFPNLRVIELDHPATQNLKTKLINSLQRKPEGLSLQPADLTVQSVSSVLAMNAFDPRQATVFLIEGVLMYLNEQQVRKTLADIHSCAGHGSRFVVTFMERSDDGGVAFGRSQKSFVNLWLNRQSEPFVWGLAPNNAAPFFDSCGWSVVGISQWEQLSQSVSTVYPAMREPAQGEHVAELTLI